MAALSQVMETEEFEAEFAPLLSPMSPEEFPAADIGAAVFQQKMVVDERGLDVGGGEILLLDTPNGDFQAYHLVRTLRDAIYGRVVSGCRVIPTEDPDRVRLDERAMVAVKMMSLQKIEEMRGRHAENPFNEIACMSFLHSQAGGHPHVLMYEALCRTQSHLFMIMPYCSGGELHSVIEENGALEPERARALFRQMTQGVEFLGRASVAHRDLSLENVLLHRRIEEERIAMLIDFGMALRIPRDKDGRCHWISRQLRAGKLHYMSPEIISQRPFDGSKIDVWALGVMLFIMLVGVPPWRMADRRDQRYICVVSGELPRLLEHWGVRVPGDAVDLLKRIFVEDIETRISIPEILRHPWYTGGLAGG